MNTDPSLKSDDLEKTGREDYCFLYPDLPSFTVVVSDVGESEYPVGTFDDDAALARDVLEALPGVILLLDAEGVIGDASHHVKALSGFSVADVIGQNIRKLVPGLSTDSMIFNCADSAMSTSPLTWSELGLELQRCDGAELVVDLKCARLNRDKRFSTVVSVSEVDGQTGRTSADLARTDKSREIEAAVAAAIAQSEQRFRLAFEGNMAPMVFSNSEGIFLEVNESYCQMSGRTREELIGRDSKHFTYPEDIGISEEVNKRIVSGETDQVRYSKRFLHKNGRIVMAEVSICSARDENGKTLYFISSVRDITEERALATQLSYQALHDPLTGLANRALFDDRLVQAKSRVERQDELCAVLLLDLDDFKGVNDVYGHLIGDQLLVSIAKRFEKVTRASDTICRFGGDEFLYLAEGLTAPSEAEKIAGRLLAALDEPFTFDDVHLEQQASVGIVVWDSNSTNSNVELIQNADASMYEAKRRGHGHLVVFTPEIRQEAVSRFALVQELRQAVASGVLQMHYQPIIDLSNSEVVGFEALMRWPHPERGWVPPDVFIPIAEQSDLILELGAFAMHEAVTAASSWQLQGDGTKLPYVTVNLSAHQFHDRDLIPMIERELKLSGLDPERLILEVTESVALLDISETMNVMDHLNRLNIGIALDDFGTGYSSLSYLAALRPRIIKIDQSFVRPKRDQARSNTLLEAIVTLGNKLDMIVLAEGIETHDQLEHLSNLHCDLGQGFLWSPAVPNGEAVIMLGEGAKALGEGTIT
jgi:diguanylate cyclase (GGDEF)-like protein/PAS domain S-box-containing protein